MGAKKPGLSIDEHLDLSDEVRLVNDLIDKWCFLWGKFPVRGREIRALDGLRKHVSEFKNVLDNDWHRKTSTEEFKKHGHVYYNRYDRVDTVEMRKRLMNFLRNQLDETKEEQT